MAAYNFSASGSKISYCRDLAVGVHKHTCFDPRPAPLSSLDLVIVINIDVDPSFTSHIDPSFSTSTSSFILISYRSLFQFQHIDITFHIVYVFILILKDDTEEDGAFILKDEDDTEEQEDGASNKKNILSITSTTVTSRSTNS